MIQCYSDTVTNAVIMKYLPPMQWLLLFAQTQCLVNTFLGIVNFGTAVCGFIM